MKSRRQIFSGAFAIALMLAGFGFSTHAQANRLTMVVGFGAGGMTDTTSRIIADKLEKSLGMPVIVENKGGAGGIVAINAVGQMPADGMTMVSFLTDGPFTAAYQGKPLNLSDWTVIGGYMPQERVLFAAKDAPFNTAQEMMEYAKKTPITMSDGGSFWSARVMEAFAKKHSLQIAVVSQRSGQAGSQAVMGGHVTMAETGTGTAAWTAAKNGDLKIIATLTPGGLSSVGLPQIPTFEKLGADYIPRMFYGYAVRAGTPTETVAKLRAAFKAVIEDAEVQAKFKKLDLTPMWIEPKTYEETLRKVAEDGVKLREYLKK